MKEETRHKGQHAAGSLPTNGGFFNPPVQPKLSVNEPGDAFEQEADAVADEVMRMTDTAGNAPSFFSPALPVLQRKCAHCEEEEKETLQRKEDSGTADVTAGSEIAGYVGSLSGSGQPLSAETKSFFEPRMGHDFSMVKVHTGPEASASASALDALAYTTGNNIVFNEGRYAPDTQSGKWLLGHELTHVAQQGAAPATGASSPSLMLKRKLLSQRNIIQRADHPTHYGKFIDKTYKAIGKHGVDINLEFEPGDNVDATTIGMVQSVKSVAGSVTQVLSPTHKLREVTKGPGIGTRIDQFADFANPLYPTLKDAPGDTLASTATGPGWGQHGFRFTDKTGAVQKQNARLIDGPTLPGSGKNSGQYFETTAVAVAGTQNGTYYGSVSWGWEKDNKGKFSVLPITVVSKDIPSPGFMDAAEKWNDTTALGTIKTAADPTQVFNNSFSKTFTLAKDTTVTAGGSVIHKNVFFTAITDPATGKKGRVKSADLKDAGDGRATIDLPLVAPVYAGPFDSIFDMSPLAQVETKTKVRIVDDSDMIMAYVRILEGPHKDKQGYVQQLGGLPFKNTEKAAK